MRKKERQIYQKRKNKNKQIYYKRKGMQKEDEKEK